MAKLNRSQVNHVIQRLHAKLNAACVEMGEQISKLDNSKPHMFDDLSYKDFVKGLAKGTIVPRDPSCPSIVNHYHVDSVAFMDICIAFDFKANMPVNDKVAVLEQQQTNLRKAGQAQIAKIEDELILGDQATAMATLTQFDTFLAKLVK